jgi:HSP20 family molecular chaperone IbpA
MSQALEAVSSNNSKSSNGQSSNGQRSAPTWRVTPHCDLYESDSEYLLVIDMPGASTESLSVELTGNELSIRAQRPASAQGADVATTTFERRIELPSDVDGGSTSAQLQGGVLRVQIAKARSARRVKIPVATN